MSPRNVEVPYYTKAQGKTPIDAALTIDTTGFVACYLGLFVTGTLLLTVTAKCSLVKAMFEFASALGTVGLSIGLTTPATGTVDSRTVWYAAGEAGNLHCADRNMLRSHIA